MSHPPPRFSLGTHCIPPLSLRMHCGPPLSLGTHYGLAELATGPSLAPLPAVFPAPASWVLAFAALQQAAPQVAGWVAQALGSPQLQQPEGMGRGSQSALQGGHCLCSFCCWAECPGCRRDHGKGEGQGKGESALTTLGPLVNTCSWNPGAHTLQGHSTRASMGPTWNT